MKPCARSIGLALLALVISSCTIRHVIADDYVQYLTKQQGSAQLPRTGKASEYFLTPRTQAFSYEFRSATIPYPHLWIVDFGRMLDATLQSADIQTAFGALAKPQNASSSGNLLIFDLQDYTFDFAAHITLKVTYSRSGSVVLDKVYTQHGKSQEDKMVWGGAFALKNAVQQSTNLALNEILRQLITDLNAQP